MLGIDAAHGAKPATPATPRSALGIGATARAEQVAREIGP